MKASNRKAPSNRAGTGAPAASIEPAAADPEQTPPASRKTSRTRRSDQQAARREAILAAALEEFSASGFAATRLDDVARRAGVAKGTIYLYFSDKESLFLELIRSMLGPVVGALEASLTGGLPTRAIAEKLFDLFVREILGTRRKDVIRLIITEGPRFPKLAEFYYHEVIEHIRPVLQALFARAFERGEISSDAMVRFPQLMIAPGLIAIVWTALFERLAPLDVRGMMQAHLDILFGERNAP
jgi:AcrR family transcriptional regulator